VLDGLKARDDIERAAAVPSAEVTGTARSMKFGTPGPRVEDCPA
jgi:hypothetical protein